MIEGSDFFEEVSGVAIEWLRFTEIEVEDEEFAVEERLKSILEDPEGGGVCWDKEKDNGVVINWCEFEEDDDEFDEEETVDDNDNDDDDEISDLLSGVKLGVSGGWSSVFFWADALLFVFEEIGVDVIKDAVEEDEFVDDDEEDGGGGKWTEVKDFRRLELRVAGKEDCFGCWDFEGGGLFRKGFDEEGKEEEEEEDEEGEEGIAIVIY